MNLIMLKSKLHHLTITDAQLEYEGSLAIDHDLLDEVHIHVFEKIMVSNLANGSRFETYAIPAPRGSGAVCLNGPAVYQGKKGDRIVVFAFGSVPENEVAFHKPRILIMGKDNKPLGGLKEV
jgi:aspartate 1-decarboxylase